MSRGLGLPVLGLAGVFAIVSAAEGQTPYIGYAYPAGGQQGTTFAVRLGGQRLEEVRGVVVTGSGISVKVVEYLRTLGPQEMTLLREQVADLKRRAGKTGAKAPRDDASQQLLARIEKRVAGYVNRPASASIASLVVLEVTVAADAEPGPRELRLVTLGGVSNPLPFHIGQLPEFSRKPMKTSELQVLGKEELALRKRPEEEVEQRITVPCTANGQIASGEVNWYRFEARQGQRLVLSTAARQLIPYIADAVPGWFQPVLAVYDAQGKELAYNDDYRFRPDPVAVFEVPADGEYLFSITDAIYRGREDFVYRVTIGELPFVTSVFPLGGQVGAPVSVAVAGWNLDGAEMLTPAADAPAGIQHVSARREGYLSNRVPFALDRLPECLDSEANNDAANAQRIELPVIVNGRLDRPGDADVFRFEGRAGDRVVAEVTARRLDSPLDSQLKLTTADGQLVAFNDDYPDAGSGLNTHHADSHLMATLPADGAYCLQILDTAREGGEEYAYRLRISPPRPDFALRVVPSSLALRGRSGGTLTVYAIRKDGFTGDIRLGLKDPPSGLTATETVLKAGQDTVKFTVKASRVGSQQPASLVVEGRAQLQDEELARIAVAAEDRMQAFLWRHLVPAEELRVLVYDPSYQPPPKRIPPELKPETTPPKPAAGSPQFTKKQVAGRLRQLKLLYDEYLLSDEFYAAKVAECEAAQ